MQNPRLAGRYAKSLVDLATERNQLEVVFKDMEFLQAVCKQNPDFVTLMKSPVIPGDKKLKIMEAVLSGRISELTTAFASLLIRKGRENVLPEIATAFLQQYKLLKGIHEVKLTTAVPVSEELKDTIVKRIQASTPMQNVELETVVDESIIGGFVLEMGDSLVDASIIRDLRDVKKQFLNNDYIFNIR
ncbi:ATP synthase F1 subunit delta [Parasegetibacter sp. NRK P23]|uniref:ATP synthase F1 subunit delta n=1 Tax=Parasegetibacter sp. NRK P23 TaxID=2942999 RepID=UPI002043C0A9|nr:ATP synthase F1 subunit delta [Parasegetibacter sp. NRK P23]MCM5529564.1 ATP synthase F1 subunit delta [Parasegetibacter sp. NRK P23]